MIRKSVFTGIIIGLILTIILLYPVFVAFIGRVLPEIGTPLDQMLGAIPLLGNIKVSMSVPLLMAMAGVASLVSLTIGSVAAWRARANTFKKGMLAGLISGLFAGFVLYIFLVSPTTTVVAGAALLSYDVDMTVSKTIEYPMGMVIPFARLIVVDELKYLVITLLFGLISGGIEGGAMGWLRRKYPSDPPPASLLECLEDRCGHRKWFKDYEEPVLSGMAVGMVGGIILMLADLLNQTMTATGAASTDAQSEWLSFIFREASRINGLENTHFLLLPILITMAFLVVVGVGGVAAFLPKNPAGCLRSRIFAALVAGTMVGLLISLPAASFFRFVFALLPQFVETSVPPAGHADAVSIVEVAMSTPGRVLMMFLFPLPVIGLVTGGFTLWGMFQGLVYGTIFSYFRLRPADRALTVRREMLQRSDGFLPRLYLLFQQDPQAILVLEHLVFGLRKDPSRARLAAAYHTLATSPDQAAQAFDQIFSILEAQPVLKLRNEILALHRMLAQGISAKTLAQITVIAPAPEDQTSSLLPPLAKTGEYLTQPLIGLKKVERVDDLNTKIIFLSSALEGLRRARIFSEGPARENFATLLPEIHILHFLLDRWESVILSTIRDIQGRAELSAALKTNKLTFAPNLPLVLRLENHGLNVAERITLQVDQFSEEYQVVEGGNQIVDILAPQDSRELTFSIRPSNAKGRLRVGWKITYGDAVKADYILEFADQVEFLEVEKPFQRIFPIPYVTGTPLQSSEMFVGRKDVFAFVRENLFGKYQNNVIVLHGQRRTGKSSILYHLGVELADTHVCVLIDMQGKAARGEVDFLYSIADDIVYTLENKGIYVDLPARKEFEESPEFFFRSRFLRCVYEALGDKNLLLMFDEFEEMQKRVEDGKLSADIFPYLRNLMQHERKVDFIFAGTHKLEELGAEYWSILFNIAIYKRITFLDYKEVSWLITQPVASSGMEYDPLAIERIYQVASGHPYFTQVICHEMVAYHNETQRSYMTVTDVENAVCRILERGEAHFKYIWAESSTGQRLILLALAEFLETGEAATLEDMDEVLAHRGRPLEKEAMLEALRNLEARDILMRSGPRSNLYRFRVDLIRRWLYATRPAYEKVM